MAKSRVITWRTSNSWEVSRFVNAGVKKAREDMLRLDRQLQSQRVTKQRVEVKA